jgi:hypothetical protein
MRVFGKTREKSATWVAGALLGAVALATLGCGGSSHKTAPVSGKVTLNGQPLAGATVTFQPVASGSQADVGLGSYGVTDEQGKYALQVVGTERKGAVVGKHRVVFTAKEAQRDAGDDRGRAPAAALPSKEFEVPAGGTDKADFSLEATGAGPTPGSGTGGAAGSRES